MASGKKPSSKETEKKTPLSVEAAIHRIGLILRDGETIFSEHVRRDVASGRHGASFQDILHVLQNGEILKPPEWDEKHENWKYKVEGIDLEEEELRVITVIVEERFRLFIVTAY